MKINFVLPSNVLNGGIRVIGILAAELISMGHDVRLFTQPHRSFPFKTKLKHSLRRGKLLRDPKDGPFLDTLLDRVTTLDERRPVCDEDLPDADVVIATWFETAPWVNALSATKGSKVYFMQDYGASGQEIEKLIPTWQMPFHFVTLTQYLKSLIQHHNPSAPITVMRNSVDHGLFRCHPRQRNEIPTIGLIYRSQPTKGMDMASKALSQIRKDIPDVKGIVVGARDIAAFEWMKSLDAPSDSELAAAYRSCDLWLFTSSKEGFGLPILEAMASRTPVISTRVGGAEDIIANGINGYLVDVGDWSSMAKAANNLLMGPAQNWVSISEAACQSVSEPTWQDAAKVFESALRDAANSN